MENKKNSPELRFAGFSEDWKEKKLNVIADIVGGGTPSTSIPEYWNGNIDWYSPTEIGSEVYANGSINKITIAGYENSSAKLLPPNRTILFTSRAGIGDMAILQKEGCTNQGFQSLVLKNGYDPYFIYSAGQLIKKYALSKASGSTFLEISSRILGDMDLSIPESEAEQQQIGSFFKNIDELITKHQKKHNRLITLKKSMLEKMFPKEGQAVPEIRFKGFEGEWEESELHTFCSIITKQTGFDYSARIKPSLLKTASKDTYPFIQNKDFEGLKITLNTDFYIPKTVAASYPNILLDRPSLLITISGKIGNVGLYNIPEKAFIGGAVGICKLLNPDIGEFIVYDLLSTRNQKYFDSLIKASSHSNITVEDIRKIKIQIPNDESESRKIGEYFLSIDKLINNHQKQMERLTNFKQSLLDKMFV